MLIMFAAPYSGQVQYTLTPAAGGRHLLFTFLSFTKLHSSHPIFFLFLMRNARSNIKRNRKYAGARVPFLINHPFKKTQTRTRMCRNNRTNQHIREETRNELKRNSVMFCFDSCCAVLFLLLLLRPLYLSTFAFVFVYDS